MQSVAYDAASNQITTPGYAYDAAGNLINDSFHSYTYDAEGNILTMDGGVANGGSSYIYDALNQRVQVKTPGSTLEYTYDFAGRRVTTWDANANFGVQGQIWWGSLPIAFRSIDNSVYFQQQDWLGTERVRTNYAGAMVNLFTSLPFGDASGQNGTSGTDQNNFHFAQLEHDSGNTDHAQFRQYSNAQGRWMSPDRYIGSYSFSNPQSLNRYTYALNNPLSYVDPTGLDCSNTAKPAAIHAHAMDDTGDGGPCDGGSAGGGGGSGGGGTVDYPGSGSGFGDPNDPSRGSGTPCDGSNDPSCQPPPPPSSPCDTPGTCSQGGSQSPGVGGESPGSGGGGLSPNNAPQPQTPQQADAKIAQCKAEANAAAAALPSAVPNGNTLLVGALNAAVSAARTGSLKGAVIGFVQGLIVRPLVNLELQNVAYDGTLNACLSSGGGLALPGPIF